MVYTLYVYSLSQTSCMAITCYMKFGSYKLLLSLIANILATFRPTQYNRLYSARQRFLANVNSRYRSSAVRLSVVCLSETFVRPTQAIEIVGNVSTSFGTLAIC